MVAAIFTSRNESDVLECSLRHMLAEGIDLILVADNSDDGTQDILRELERDTGRVTWSVHPDPVHRQPALVNMLAERALEQGADWVIASDCDEFWYAPSGQTISDALLDLPPCRLYGRRYLHSDWDTRRRDHEQWPKVAFPARWAARVTNGNHDVSVPGIDRSTEGLLEIREIPYRSFEHYKRKVADRIRTFDRRFEAEGGGWHMLRQQGMSDTELQAEYDALLSLPSVHDPIPSRTSCRPR